MELLLRSDKYFFFYKSIPETLPTPFQRTLLSHNIKRLETVTWLVVRGPCNLVSGAPGRIRTPDPLIRSQVLYPAELPVHEFAVYARAI